MANQHEGALETLRRGINIFAPYWINNTAGTVTQRVEAGVVEAEELEPGHVASNPEGADTFTDDLLFGAHYFLLRDYLYYGYSDPDSISISPEAESIRLSFAKRSIPRQYFIMANTSNLDWIENLKGRFGAGTGHHSAILEGLIGTPEFGEACRTAVLELVEAEAAFRLQGLLPFLESDIDLGRYTFLQFSSVYKVLIAKSLYHRYWADANGEPTLHVDLGVDEIVQALQCETELDREVVLSVLQDLTYGLGDRQLPPIYYSMFYDTSRSRLILGPNLFLAGNGYVNALRISAARDPNF